MEFKIKKFESVTSTNDILKQNANDFESGTVLVSKEQTAGRGRMGRSFYSPPTGLYFSILLKEPEISTTSLTIISAVAVMKGVYETFGIKTQVKWVNDIIFEGKKICGILAEGAFYKNKLAYAVVGIGINLSTEKFPEEIKNIAGSLNQSEEKKDALLKNILKIFAEEIENSDSKNYLDFYKKNCLTLNKKVKLILQENILENAFAFDLNENGELIVKTENGEIKKIFFGEAKVI